jgi:spore coat polysaccharide biosynthesis protein SpsF
MNLVLIQARSGSSRFPGKIFKKIGKNTLLEWVIKRTKMIKSQKKIILCTTCLEQDAKLKKVAFDNQILFFQGSEKNVLKRFFDITRKNNFKSILRICADNPFVCPKEIDILIKNFNDKSNVNYMFNHRNFRHFKFADGFGAEIFSKCLLNKIFSLARNKQDLEHVTNYLWKNDFPIVPAETKIPLTLRRISIDINYEEDLKKINNIVTKYNLNYKTETLKILSFFIKDRFFLRKNTFF